MKYDCLIVDDEKALADNTSEYFNMFDVSTRAVYTSAEARAFLEENTVSLALLDINLADGSGFELCKHIRKTLDIPILFVSVRDSDDDKIIGLSIGGDDYVEKPYSLGVLLAKVKVMLRRYTAQRGKAAPDEAYDDGYIRIDRVNRLVYVRGEEKKLTGMEYALLNYFCENRNRLLTKRELFDNVWNDKFTSDGTLNVHVRRLREAIEEDPQNPRRIVTVWKEGYKYLTGAREENA